MPLAPNLTEHERSMLMAALRGNAIFGKPIYLDNDTGFVGGDGAAEDARVVSAISSLAVHYAR